MKGKFALRKLHILILAVIVSVAFCACGGGVDPITKNISFKAHISYYDKTYICPTVITGDGSVLSEIESPEVLSGMRFIYSDGKSAVEYKGMRYDFSGNDEFYTITDKICRVLRDSSECKIPKSRDNFTLNGETGGEKYSIVFSPSGLPLSMQIGTAKVEFQDITINLP